MKTRTLALAGAALIAFAPVTAAFAGTVAPDTLDSTGTVDEDDGDGGYWGLLGLLGLFGPLLGPKRRDDTVHVNRTSGRNDGNPLT